MDEFALIRRYFDRGLTRAGQQTALLGIGDDAAVVEVPSGQQLAQSIDTLVAGRHFPETTAPRDIGFKSLAVNVSDLVAMAATPAWFLLSLTLPSADERFVKEFAEGLFQAAERFGISLVGGDTCRGPLSITIQASGLVERNHFLTRSGASVGDRIFVSGELGTAALGLAHLLGRVELDGHLREDCLRALNRPEPRIDLLPILREFASAAIDLSDGLASDLGHVLAASKVGARVDRDALPVTDWIRQRQAYDYALTGGDDYQILFTVESTLVDKMLKKTAALDADVTDIGEITAAGDYHLTHALQGEAMVTDMYQLRGFNHFIE